MASRLSASFARAFVVMAALSLACGDGSTATGSGTGTGTTGSGSGTGTSAGDDVTPPTFNDPLEIEVMGETRVNLTWPDATDDVSDPADISYRIYWASERGGQAFGDAPQAAAEPGANSFLLEDLRPGQPIFVVVHAVDEAGNESTNVEDSEALTLDTTAPEFGGIEGLTPTAAGGLEATWSAATDNGTDPVDIRYAVFVSQVSGEHDFASPHTLSDPGVESVEIAGLDEYTEYFVTVRSVDLADNADNNVVERVATTLDVTAPTFGGATSVAAAGSAVQLQWDPASDNVDAPTAIRYNVYFSETAGGQDFTTPAATTSPGATVQTLTNMALDTEFFFVVRAVDQAGNEDTNSLEQTARTGLFDDETPPMFGGLVLVEAQTATTVYVAWDEAVDDLTDAADIVYDVYLGLSLGMYDFMAPIATTTPGETNHVLTGLIPETTYYVVVRARDLSGNQDSNMVEGLDTTPADTTAPFFAGIQSATGTGATTVRVDWTAATDDVAMASEISYRVFMADTSGGQDFGAPVGITNPGATTYTVTGLLPNQTRYFVVRAVDTYGNADANLVELPATTLADTTPPTFAGVTAALAQDETSVLLSWANASDDVSLPADIYYNVYVGTTSGGQDFFSPVLTTSPGATIALVTGLDPGEQYYFVVRAVDEAGNEDSNTIERTEITDSDTDPPTFAGAQSVSDTAATSLRVNWNEATDNATVHANMVYEVCRSSSAGGCLAGGWSANEGSVTGATFMDIMGLTADQTYYFRVRARDEAGNLDSNTAVVSGTTSSDVTPPVFAGLTSASPLNATQIQLTWSAASDNVSSPGQIVYDIYRATTSGGQNYASPTYTTAAGATSYDAGGLNDDTTYYFVARARDTANNRDSNTVQRSATTPVDNTDPVGGAVTSVVAQSCSSLRAHHAAATDDVTSPGNIRFRTCVSTSSTGCNGGWHVDATQTGGTYVDVSGLSTGTQYVRIRAEDEAGNLNGNTTVLSTSLTDGTPPSWVGSVNASPVYGSTYAAAVQLTWTQANDACSSNSSITYEICRFPNGVGVNCTSTWNAMYTSGTTESRLITSSDGSHPLSPDTSYTFYVRARDTSNNQETGIHSAGATTGVSYSQNISPIYTNVCNGCHSWSYATTVNTASSWSPCGSGYTRVNPGSAATSLIYNKMSVSPPCGNRMPDGGPYDQPSIDLMQKWINQGAYNN